MAPRVHYLQHVPFERLGSIKPWLAARNCRMTSTALYAGDDLPDRTQFDWLIVMGGPMGVHDGARFSWLEAETAYIQACIEDGKTVLGICLGAQLIARALGADVRRNPECEIGWYAVHRDPLLADHALAAVIPDQFTTFHWHGDTFDIPEHARRLAGSEACTNQGFVFDNRVVGLQFHAEMALPQIQSLIDHCANEIVSAPFIQSGRDMVGETPRHVDVNLNVMDRLLNYLFQQCRT